MTRQFLLQSEAWATPDSRRYGFALFSAALTAHVLLYGLTSGSGVSFWIAGAPLAIGGLVTAIAALTWPRWFTSKLESLARRLHPLIILAVIAAGVGFGLLMRPEWVYAHGGLWLAVTGGIVWTISGRGARPIPRWIGIAAAVAALIAVTVVRLYGLSVYPTFDATDEPWDLAWAVGYAETGMITDPIMPLSTYQPQLFMALPGLWVRAFGADFWTARVFFFLLTLLLCAVTGWAAARLYSRRIGWIAAGLMFASAVVMVGARIRHDIGLALAVAVGIGLFAEGLRRERAIWHVGAGLVISLGALAHLHAALFAPGLALAFFVPGIVQRERGAWRGLAAYVVGMAIGAAIVIPLQFTPALGTDTTARQTRLPDSIDRWIEMIAAYVNLIAVYSRIELLIIAAAVIAAVWRGDRRDWTIALAIGGLHIGLGFVAASAVGFSYLVPITPFYAIAIAALCARGLSRASEPSRDRASGAASAITLAAVMIGVTLAIPLRHVIARDPLRPLPDAPVAWLRDQAAPDQVIVGPHAYYLYLTDRRFVSPFFTDYLSASERARYGDDAALWEAIAPDYVVLDPNRADFCFAMIICQTDYLTARGYRPAQTFPGEREPIVIYARSTERNP